MTTVKLANNGQLIIPQRICEQLHWEEGSDLTLEITATGVLLTSRPKEKRALRGFLKNDAKPITPIDPCQPVDYTEDWSESELHSR